MLEIKGKYCKDVEVFTDNVEESALSTIYSMANCKAFEGKKIRIMPDVHNGNGTVVGLSYNIDIEDENETVNPDYIGCDIGCSVTGTFFDKAIKVEDIAEFEYKIRNAVPFGNDINSKKKIEPKEIIKSFTTAMNRLASMYPSYAPYVIKFKCEDDLEKWCKRIKMEYGTFLKTLGTVGGGNHFCEYGVNEELNKYCVTVHCGSRNLGLKVFKYWHNIANNSKRLKEGQMNGFLYGEDFKRYIVDLMLAQEYALLNHQVIINEIAQIYKKICGGKIIETIPTMHNYIDLTEYKPMLRKGAISSYEGELMLIPFNMRDGIAVCVGKSNDNWNNTAPHGAGRIMSRAKAKQTLSVEEYQSQLLNNGVYSTTANVSTLDEAPDAYKPMEEIVKLIEPTAKIEYFLKPKMNIKAGISDEEI